MNVCRVGLYFCNEHKLMGGDELLLLQSARMIKEQQQCRNTSEIKMSELFEALRNQREVSGINSLQQAAAGHQRPAASGDPAQTECESETM